MSSPGTFDPLAPAAGGLTAGDPITDTAPAAGLFGVSQAVSVVPVTLKHGGPPMPPGISGPVLPPTMAPYESVLKMFYSLDPDARASLQQRMFNAGLYPDAYNTGKKQIVPGGYDDDSFKVWSGVVEKAARSEKTPDEVLTDMLSGRSKAGVGPGGAGGSGAGGSGTGATRAPFSPVVTNPLDIRDTAQVTAKKTLGRQFSDDELNRFVSAFQGMETGAQATNYNAAAAGGRTVAAPSMDAAAANQARTVAPVEAGAHDLAGVYDNFLSILKGQ